MWQPMLGNLLYPGAWFQGPEPGVYLSYDDGPDPQYSLALARIAAEQNAALSFFWLGEKILQHPQLIQSVGELGHQIGFHGHRHWNGWRRGRKEYVENARPPQAVRSGLYRPPYGRLWPAQCRAIQAQQQVVFWSHMPGDFNLNISDNELERRALSALRPGAILALHDWGEAGRRNLRLLPRILRELELLRLPALALPSAAAR